MRRAGVRTRHRSGRIGRIFASVLATAACLTGAAQAQVAAQFRWQDLGLADGTAIPRTTSQSDAGVTTTAVWTPTDNGQNGNFSAYAAADYVTYSTGTQGGVSNYARFGFDNDAADQGDRLQLIITFSEAVTDVRFTLSDIDQASWDDFVEVWYDTGNGFQNARTTGGGFGTLIGNAAIVDNETFGNGWEGDLSAAASSTDGNIDFDFGSQPVTRIRFRYRAGADTGANPGGQQLGFSDIAFTANKQGADLSLTKSVTNPGAAAGDTVAYLVTLSNSGPSPASVVVRDLLPSGVTYVSSNAGSAYDPNSGLWTLPGPIGPGGSETLQITATVNASGAYTNTAQVWTSDQNDPDSTPGNSASGEDDQASVTITPGAGGGGTPPPLSCASPRVVDWDAQGWPGGTFAHDATVAGVFFDFVVGGDTGALFANTPFINTQMTNGSATTGGSVIFGVNFGTSGQLTFEADVGQPGFGVGELQFLIFDIDQTGGAQDRVTVTGSLNGAAVPALLTPGSANTVSGQTATGTAASADNTSAGTLGVTFLDPVDRVVVTIENGPGGPADPGNQVFAVHDFRFCEQSVAAITATKSVAMFSGGSGTYALPGEDVAYSLVVTNGGEGPADPGSLFLVDPVPTDVTLWTGAYDGTTTEPVRFSQSGSSLTLPASGIRFAGSGAQPTDIAQCTAPTNGGYDASIRYVCIEPQGQLPAGNPDPTFTVTFRARID